MNKAQLADRLFATFLDELDEQLRVLNADLLVLERDPADAARLRSIFRVVHTLKGAARAVNVTSVEQACHALESLLAAVRADMRRLGPDEFALLFRAADALSDAGRRLRGGQSLVGSPIEALGGALSSGTETPPARAAERVAAPPPSPAADPRSATVPEVAPAPPELPLKLSEERTDGALRVQSDKLDAVFAGMGALSITSGRIADRAGEIAALEEVVTQSLRQWRSSVRRLRRGSTRSEASPALEAIGAAGESWERISRQLSRIAAAATRDAATVDRLMDQVSERVRVLRMRPFADACDALPRVARDVAAASGKEVRLEIVGAEVEADRAVLDGIREALVQLVRNAVDHGIEPTAVRERRGKPTCGTVTVSAALRGDRLVVTISDDGGGVDVERVKDSLARAGRTVTGDTRAVASALLGGGVSSRVEASAFSGRGVGIDVARAAAARLGGRLEMTWKEGEGTRFELDTPLTLARIRAVMATIGGQVLAVPTSHVERLFRLPRASIRRVEGQDVFSAPHAGVHSLVRVLPLARLLGPPMVDAPPGDPMSVILLSVGGERLGVIVDELQGEDELFVRALPGRGALPAHLGGAALLTSGKVALLLDADALVARSREMVEPGVSISGDRAIAGRRSTVLVVDDSLTTRTLERSVLEAAGYIVKTAVDGADGWRVIDEEGCDLVVADVEMPRMDGLALCEAIRASERHRSLPVILVTALESAEHRARGLSVGADAYIGKSGFDQTNLLDTVAQLLDPEAE